MAFQFYSSSVTSGEGFPLLTKCLFHVMRYIDAHKGALERYNLPKTSLLSVYVFASSGTK